MAWNKTTPSVLGVLLLLAATSCSPFRPKELAALPVAGHPDELDSPQARAVYNAAEHFPNGTEISICMIVKDSEKYVGVLRRNDSLVYDGKINPDDPMQKFLPVPLKQSALNGSEILLVHLANHTSGLPFEPPDVKTSQGKSFDNYNPYRTYDIPRLYNYLSHDMVLQSTPGEKRTYSNLGFGLLGHLLTLATGKTYEELLFWSVCTPLGMQRTFVAMSDERGRMMA